MSDPYNEPAQPNPPEPGHDPRPLRPDSVEWWSPPSITEGPVPRRELPTPEFRPVGRPNYLLHLGLFLAACVTTTMTDGPLYGATIMGILLAHEMGHYIMARRYHVPATLPYFIPMPISLFGTMGAVIRMGSLGADRKALFDIGVAGPIAGLVLALPACVLGISLSHVVKVSTLAPGTFNLGSPLLFQWISDWIKGPMPAGYDINLHPIAFAGWAGMFVTALNLIPVGQLDGGHAAYAVLGPRVGRIISTVALLGFVAMAIFVSKSWLVMAALLLFMGFRHPPTGNDDVPLGTGRRLIGAALLIMFVLLFTPRPFSF